MKKLTNTLSRIFSILSFIFFLACAGQSVHYEGWTSTLAINFGLYIGTFLLAMFFKDPKRVFRHVHAIVILLVSKIVVATRPNSKLALALKRKFRNNRAGRFEIKLSGTRVYRAALYDYDKTHKEVEVGGKYAYSAK